MNAWNEKSSEESSSENREETNDLSFEDNFTVTESEKTRSSQFKLSDHEEYLSKLEKRLHKIKNNPDVLKQLEERREACMNHLLNNSEDNTGISSDHELDLDQPLNQNETASEIFRHIRPEQAQTVGEIVHIIKHDQLNEGYVADNNSDNSSLADR